MNRSMSVVSRPRATSTFEELQEKGPYFKAKLAIAQKKEDPIKFFVRNTAKSNFSQVRMPISKAKSEIKT